MSRHVCHSLPAIARAGSEERACEWLERAKAGDPGARQALLGWAYGTAFAYYTSKLDSERTLTRTDAEDLAGSFVVEFHGAWHRVFALRNYTRRMLRNNLNRYLKRKREVRSRETPLACEEESEYGCRVQQVTGDDPPDAGTEEMRRRQAAVRKALEDSDEATRALMMLRVSMDEPSYRVLSHRLGLSESALRMRAARFYRMVRDEHDRLTATDVGCLVPGPRFR